MTKKCQDPKLRKYIVSSLIGTMDFTNSVTVHIQGYGQGNKIRDTVVGTAASEQTTPESSWISSFMGI